MEKAEEFSSLVRSDVSPELDFSVSVQNLTLSITSNATNGTEQGDRNRRDTQNKNQKAHSAEESEEEGSNKNNVHIHPVISMKL